MTARLSSDRVRIKRIYEPASADDGTRILVDRLWPRGIRKEQNAFDRWLREISPSTELRRWFGHDPTRWAEFRERYAEELRTHDALLRELRTLARDGPITLLYSAHDEAHNNAVVIREALLGRLRTSKAAAS